MIASTRSFQTTVSPLHQNLHSFLQLRSYFSGQLHTAWKGVTTYEYPAPGHAHCNLILTHCSIYIGHIGAVVILCYLTTLAFWTIWAIRRTSYTRSFHSFLYLGRTTGVGQVSKPHFHKHSRESDASLILEGREVIVNTRAVFDNNSTRRHPLTNPGEHFSDLPVQPIDLATSSTFPVAMSSPSSRTFVLR